MAWRAARISRATASERDTSTASPPRGDARSRPGLHEPTDLPRTRNELQLKFFLCSRQPLEESIRLLEEYREQQRELRELYADSERILRRAVRDCALADELQEVLPSDEPERSDTERRNEALIFLLTLRHGVLKGRCPTDLV